MRRRPFLVSRRWPWFVRAVLTATAAFTMVSCQPGRYEPVPLFPVKGAVFSSSKPAAGESVVLHPVASSQGERLLPSAIVVADGTFALTTYENNDGAPAGNTRSS